MPNNTYQVIITFTAGLGVAGGGCVTVSNKTVNGFDVRPINCNGGGNLSSSATFSWMAISTN